MLWQHGPDHWREAAQHRVAGKSEDPGYLCRKQPRSRRRHGHEGEADADNSFSRLFPTFTRISLKRNSLGGGSQPRLSDSSPQRPTKEAGERCSSLFPLLCSYNPLPRSVAATDVGQMADKAVAGWGKPITRT